TFTRTGRANECSKVVAINAQVNAMQDLHFIGLANIIRFSQRFQTQNFLRLFRHDESPPPDRVLLPGVMAPLPPVHLLMSPTIAPKSPVQSKLEYRIILAQSY